MKVRSKLALMAVLVGIFSLNARATVPGDKRTILTSGDKVYTIHYQLGQSTVLYLGVRPDTVICGNKNYFNIEKLKEAVTIQPLSSVSTNLTIMTEGRRYLFYLTPAAGVKSDGFVDVRWIPSNQLLELKSLQKSESVLDLSVNLEIAKGLKLTIVRLIRQDKRTILDLALMNDSSQATTSRSIEANIFEGKTPLRQILTWEEDSAAPSATIKGRIILLSDTKRPLVLVVKYSGRTFKTQLKVNPH